MKYFRYLLMLVCLAWQCSYAAESFSAFVQDKTEHAGYYPFYYAQATGKIFLEIDKFNQPFLFQSSMPYGIGSNDIGLDRGQLGATRLVQFERVGDKVLLRQLNTDYRADSSNAQERQAVTEAFASSVIWGFKVVQVNPHNHRVIIDYTPFLLSDIHHISETLKQQKQGSYHPDASRSAVYLPRSKAFANNTELEATVTYVGSGAGDYLRSVTPESDAVSVHLHHSLIKLPDDHYQPRVFQPYCGYWSMAYADYASSFDQPLIKRFIPRHRLQKKHPQQAISEAVQPIIYYLDAGVPEPIRTALLTGAGWWDQAFSALGYKHAFQIKMLPKNADPMDIRYNVIQWVHRATRGWSYGASVIDPRTGEIIKGHVTLGSLRVRQDYLLALAMTSPFNKQNTDTSAMRNMALARIRQLAAHEVGHTLGLAHNFASSVNQRASVMDYPHPYITEKNGQLDLSNAYAQGIGKWDKFTIAYGYGDYPQPELNSLQQLIAKAQAAGLQYLSDPDARPASSASANAHLWDNGRDPTVELTRVMQVRDVALAHFGLNSIADNTPLSELEQELVLVYNFHRYQVTATSKLIAGLNYSYTVKGDNTEQGVSFVRADQQQQALKVLLSTLDAHWLTIPESVLKLIPPKAYGYQRNRESFPAKTGLAFDPVSAAQANVQATLALLLNPARLARLQQQHARSADIFSANMLVHEVVDGTIKKAVNSGLAGLIQQRINQTLVEQLLALYLNPQTVTEVKAAVYNQLMQLSAWLTQNTQHNALAVQYQLLKQQISTSLAKGKLIYAAPKVAMPPGSPIG